MSSPLDTYLDVNKDSWNRRLAYHLDSEMYNVKAFLEGEDMLDEITPRLLGDLAGKSLLHLQCHFGQDTLCLARRGARCTGIDLSDKCIEMARTHNEQLGLDARFVASDVYDLPNQLQGQFDIVFTSYGTIGWLPDMDRWASVVAHFLKPGGRFVFAEFHPVIWMFDDDFEQIAYAYDNKQAIEYVAEGTYAEQDADDTFPGVNWNHSISEVVSALLGQGLQLRAMQEYDFSPYACLKDMETVGPKRYRVRKLGDKVPYVYSLVMEKLL